MKFHERSGRGKPSPLLWFQVFIVLGFFGFSNSGMIRDRAAYRDKIVAVFADL
jgi:hypothetical protein